MAISKNQLYNQFLIDQSSTGRVYPWREKKVANELLSYAYQDVDPRKAERLTDCATFLAYAVQGNGHKRLKSANFCRVRLCPICQWRRSLKTYMHMHKIMAAVEHERSRGYILVTLTMRNCDPDQLGSVLTQLIKSFGRMMEYARPSKSIKGWYRGVEITHNLENDTYHPHIHMVCAVNKTYFKNKEYIPQAEWTGLWKRALRVDYDPIVDVRRIKGNDPKAVAEVAKYAVKDSDYIIPDDWDLTVDTVALLDKVLDNRRFVAYGGLFKYWHKKLNLDDDQDGDLLHIEDDSRISEDDPIIVYQWSTGYRQYMAT